MDVIYGTHGIVRHTASLREETTGQSVGRNLEGMVDLQEKLRAHKVEGVRKEQRDTSAWPTRSCKADDGIQRRLRESNYVASAAFESKQMRI